MNGDQYAQQHLHREDWDEGVLQHAEALARRGSPHPDFPSYAAMAEERLRMAFGSFVRALVTQQDVITMLPNEPVVDWLVNPFEAVLRSPAGTFYVNTHGVAGVTVNWQLKN